MSVYKNRLEDFENQRQIVQKKATKISFLRILLVLFLFYLIYEMINTATSTIGLLILLVLGAFFYLVKLHSEVNQQKKHLEALMKVNKNEIDFLENNENNYEDGSEFIDTQHQYAFDLDIFGKKSVFQHLNRTNTFIGKKTFSQLLKNILPKDYILNQQIAVRELSDELDFRQHFMANAINSNDSESVYKRLMLWAQSKSVAISKSLRYVAFISPILFALLAIGYFITDNATLITYLSSLFVGNLFILGQFYKKIAKEIQYISEVDSTIKNYGIMIENIENQNFKSKKLNQLKDTLLTNKSKASAKLKQLSEIFGKMDAINNLVTTIFFNGTFLFHIHTLNQLLKWKKIHATELETWLNTIGEFESLISLSNFAYNNVDFVFPELNNDFKISFENLVHPLINPNKRVGNSIAFEPQSFYILTGSNMSGKSTFLRSLGLNLILSGIGSVVCATKANTHTMPVLVAMRTSDSIAESESYFYAEIKRLKKIMDTLDNQKCFVLLDEILRGTNSDDKQTGTIAVVEKMISKLAVGVIATHDVEVCLTSNKYPKILENKCFEAQIINDDLVFDYQLRDGICQNKSATFLMQKLDII
jgi:DNA mismatch repair ATPase MutS